MNAKELQENFTNQFNAVVEDINSLESQLVSKKEIALKLKGALEALKILEEQSTEPQETEE
jgi:hypothetical protein